MGFLLGVYAKQMAGKRVRSLQARMIRIQSQLRRATRDIEQREKYWTKVERDVKNSIMSQANTMMVGIGQTMQAGIWNSLGQLKDANNNNINMSKLAQYDQKEWEKLTPEAAKMINEQMSAATQQNGRISQALQTSLQQTLSLQEQDIEMQKEAELRPLKDLEEELQTEKDSLEAQLQLADQDYKQCDEMIKGGVKSLTPNYTGQG